MASLLQRLKERKLVQWALAYLAGAWALVEATNLVVEQFHWPEAIGQTVTVAAFFGFFVALVLAWYHGEKGRQRVSGPELLMLTAVFVTAGAVITVVGRGSRAAWSDDGPAAGEGGDVAAILSRLPSVAVLPFANRSGVPDDQYFTDGIQDDLLTRLQRVRALRVISRTTTDAYRNTATPTPEIGRDLGVDYVVEGGVQRAGDRVRVNVQLIDALADRHVWSETYDRTVTLENLLDIQSQIVETVAGQLNISLREEERQRAARRSATNLEAYELYLRGTNLPLGSEEGISLLNRAIERDPAFVGAHAALAKALAYQHQVVGLRSEESARAARRAAELAVELAPESEDAQLAMGLYFYRVEKDWGPALEWLGRASGSLLGDYDYQVVRAYTERRMGQWSRSVASFRAALSLSPRSAVTWQELGTTLTRMQRYADAEEALLEYQRLSGGAPLQRLAELIWYRDGNTEGWAAFIERYPTHRWSWEALMTDGRHREALAAAEAMEEVIPGQHWWFPRALLEAETLDALGQEAAAREKYAEAVDILEPLAEETPEDERFHDSLGRAYAGLGMRDAAVREATRAVEIMPRERDAMNGPFHLFNLAAVHARLGDVDDALRVLEDLLSAPSKCPANMLEDHFRLRPIQADPRFKALMDRERNRVF